MIWKLTRSLENMMNDPMRRTTKERIWIIQKYYRFENITDVIHRWEGPDPPCFRTIQNLVSRFEETGSVADLHRSGRPVTVTTPENHTNVNEHFQAHPTDSIRQTSQHLSISSTSLQRIVSDLGLHAYRLQHTHWLFDQDYNERRSPDLTPCDFWLWSAIAEHVYAADPRTVQHLKQRIEEAVANLPVPVLARTCRNVLQRCNTCIERAGNSVEI
ncbi:hypothetical protein BLNAU_19729 [Blattamonas nauphoetae]|uniref:DUF4817 domain-containing protein n=1 Tax=Blattamonas nauphoetae TaxID=2049346 RepID=A0ABQ9X4U6_9EUKA|nr:hypothetical protein BLNAU_19729 [Blattamonas nauphoetae]